MFRPAVTTQPQYHVYTAGTSAAIPDLGAASVALPALADYTWSVSGFAPIASVDAWAGASGPPIPNPFAQGTSQSFGFKTR